MNNMYTQTPTSDFEAHSDYLDGVDYDSESQLATFGNEMFEEFRKFCIQESATYEVVNRYERSTICRVESSVVSYFVKCMESEKFETIRMLCMLSKEMLTMRQNNERFNEHSEQWIGRIDIKLIEEALGRYDDQEFATEREVMHKLL